MTMRASSIRAIWRDETVTGCTVEVEHSNEALHAHVHLDGEPVIRPGDRVRVNGAPVRVAFGERVVLRREATIAHANRIEQWWAKLTGNLILSELYEVSFTPRVGL